MPDYPRASLLVWRTATRTGDTPRTIAQKVLERLREENRADPARELSLAIQHCEAVIHRLRDLEERRTNGGST